MKKIFIVFIALLLIFSTFALSCGEKESEENQEIAITFKVVHADKSEKSFEIKTSEKYLGAALEKEGLISGEKSEYGLYVKTVDGETADEANEGWWCLYEGEESALTGVDTQKIKDGGVYSFVYTVGY